VALQNLKPALIMVLRSFLLNSPTPARPHGMFARQQQQQQQQQRGFRFQKFKTNVL
jgi:hypothetical protein